MYLKKIICLFISLAVLLQPLASQAVDLNSAFSSLMGPDAAYAVNTPGHYQSGARNGFSAGGIDVRVPRGTTVPNLFSVTPPTLTAGCSGISAHFGGFSFISSAQFEALLKQIASGAALGFVTSLVMKTLCPACEAVVQELKTAAQAAARLARDSCQWGKQMGDAFMAGNGVSTDPVSLCAMTSQSTGSSGDSQAAYSDVCTSLQTSITALKSFNKSLNPDGTPMSPAQQAAHDAQLKADGGFGNQTWTRLSAFDSSGTTETDAEDNYRRKLLLLNIMGAQMSVADDGSTVGCDLKDGTSWVAADDNTGQDSKAHFCPPTLDSQKMMGYFMCGSPSTYASSGIAPGSAVAKYCSYYMTDNAIGTSNQIYECKGASNSATSAQARASCDYLSLVAPDATFGGTGLLITVNKYLKDAVTMVQTNTSFNSDEGKKIIQLIQVAPYPLYQAINAAAVYPAAADDLMDNMSVMVAEQFAYSLFDETIRIKGRTSSNVALSQPQAEAIMKFIDSLRAANTEAKTLMGQNFAQQQVIAERIRQINLSIQRQVMSAEMLNTGEVANAFSKTVSQSLSKTGAAAPSNNSPTTP